MSGFGDLLVARHTHTLEGHQGAVPGYSAKRDLVATTGFDGTCRVWRPEVCLRLPRVSAGSDLCRLKAHDYARLSCSEVRAWGLLRFVKGCGVCCHGIYSHAHARLPPSILADLQSCRMRSQPSLLVLPTLDAYLAGGRRSGSPAPKPRQPLAYCR